MKSMVIGLGPEYNYPGEFSKWREQNTRYASNHGASFISRALARQFDADYVDDFSDLDALRRTYDCCLIAFASHVSDRRDVSLYADVVERLDMKTVAISLGIRDYSEDVGELQSLHPSLIRLLRVVERSSELIGVRGYYTASLLQAYGFTNVVPVGCPTFFWNLKPELRIEKPATFSKPLVAYHRKMAVENQDILKNTTILGQDFLDEAVFTKNLVADTKLRELEGGEYRKLQNGQQILDVIGEWGVFPRNFQEWFTTIGNHDFVFGSRLHGTVAALVQGIPAVLIVRDVRTLEMARMFKIPHVTIAELKHMTKEQLYDAADYSAFSSNYSLRYDNYLSVLEENGLSHKLAVSDPLPGYRVTPADMGLALELVHKKVRRLELELAHRRGFGFLPGGGKHRNPSGGVNAIGRLYRRMLGK